MVERTRRQRWHARWSELDAGSGGAMVGMHGGANSTPAAAVRWCREVEKVVVMLVDVSEAAVPVADLPREESE